MIYLIDFPGYGIGNFFEKGICNKVISICNLLKNRKILKSEKIVVKTV